MASTSNLAKTAQVLIEKASIRSNIGREYDITNLLNDISFTESLNSKVLYGKITMTESLNLLEAIPIMSEETVHIVFSVPYEGTPSRDSDEDETYTMEFEIFSVSDVNVVSEKTLSYTLNITSAVYNQFVKLGPVSSFKDSISNIVDALIKPVSTELSVAPTKDFFIEETSSKHHLVFPALSISEALDVCVKRANSTAKNGHTYKFYESTKAFNFRSIGTLIEQKPVMSIYYSIVNFDDDNAKTGLFTDSALGYSVVQRNDSSQMLYDGAYRANIISFDPILKKIVKKEYIITDEIDQKRILLIDDTLPQTSKFLNYNTTDIAETFSYTNDLGRSKNEYAKNKEDFFPEQYNDFMLESNASKALLKGTVVSITIAGTTRVSAGDMINFFPPDQSAISNPDYDKYLSGKYLVSEIEHTMSADQYIMKLTCLKSGLPEPIEASE
jgi:hypothetical protein